MVTSITAAIDSLSTNLEDLENQEHVYHLNTFNAEVAFQIGVNALDYAKKTYPTRPVVIDITTASGVTLFRAVHGQAIPDNEVWISKKRNTVLRYQSSSLKFGQVLKSKNRALKDVHLDPTEYTEYGGGFPIRLVTAPDFVVAVLTVSGLKDHEDHYLALRALKTTVDQLA